MQLPEIESERLILRCIEIEDAPDIFEYMQIDEVSDCLFSSCKTLEDTIKHIKVEFLSYEQRELPSPYAIVLKESGKVIGTCNFHTADDTCGEIGFVLNPLYEHQGYMQESLFFLLEVGFDILKFKRIQAMHIVGNLKSERCLKACGFVEEGILRSYYYKEDKPLDMKIYSVLESEWRKYYE